MVQEKKYQIIKKTKSNHKISKPPVKRFFHFFSQNMYSLLKEARETLIGNEIGYGSPGYPMKAKPKKITKKTTKAGVFFEVDYLLYNSWDTKKWEDNHYFTISEDNLKTLLEDGEVFYSDFGKYTGESYVGISLNY